MKFENWFLNTNRVFTVQNIGTTFPLSINFKSRVLNGGEMDHDRDGEDK